MIWTAVDVNECFTPGHLINLHSFLDDQTLTWPRGLYLMIKQCENHVNFVSSYALLITNGQIKSKAFKWPKGNCSVPYWSIYSTQRSWPKNFKEIMSEKTCQLADTTYAHSLVIKSTHEYKSVPYPLIPQYERRLCRQVGAPLWFSPTLPLNTFSNPYTDESGLTEKDPNRY